MSVESDLDKKVTFGDADGPDVFVDQLGFVVPTFIDPRVDLLPKGTLTRFKRVSHHIPFQMRGHFKPEDWPEEYRQKVEYSVNDDGYVLCAGISENGKKSGQGCRSKAANRTQFCRNHGGGLHPLDKKISTETTMPAPLERIKGLDRPQRFMQGFLPIEDLADEEITGMFVYDDAGKKVSSLSLGIKIHQRITQELHRRMNRFLQTKTASMLTVMVDIAESDLVEPADRIKAAQWVAERTLGKTPDVIIHGTTEQPYETIFESIDAGSRDSYRKSIESHQVGNQDGSVAGYLDILDAEVDEEDGSDEESNQESEPFVAEVAEEVEINSNVSAAHDLERQKELRKARSKAKQRRYAARAMGASTAGDMSWAIEWKFLGDGTHQMRLVCPDDQTQARLDKIEKSNALAREKAEAWRNENVAQSPD